MTIIFDSEGLVYGLVKDFDVWITSLDMKKVEGTSGYGTLYNKSDRLAYSYAEHVYELD